MTKTLQRIAAVVVCVLMMYHAGAQRLSVKQVKAFIAAHAAELHFSSTDLADYRISDSYLDNTTGAMLVYLQQTYQGIDVYNAVQTLAIKNNTVRSFSGKRLQYMEKGLSATPAFTAVDGVKAALKHLNLPSGEAMQQLKTGLTNVYSVGKLKVTENAVRARLAWSVDHTQKAPALHLTWQVEIKPYGTPDFWLVKVDAIKGNVIGKDNYTVYCDWKSPSMPGIAPTGNRSEVPAIGLEEITDVSSSKYLVIPYPAESPQAAGGAPAVQINPWLLSSAGNNATTLQWHTDGATTYDSTRGNNVLAREDTANRDDSGRAPHSLTPLPNLDFSFTPDFSKQPTTTTNQNFAITNLFYWNNILHDLVYQYGFDEVSGNFQASNMGRGGLDGDYVFADAQDGSGSNNSNFSTPPDGFNPRMQMYLFNGTPKLDGDLDNGVISHEFTHGVSNRLTGGPSEAGCLSNDEQMGEGWSDYVALMMTTNWATATPKDGKKKRPIGTYVEGQDTSGSGIRTQPYSTDIAVNTLTYKSVKNAGIGSFFDPHFVGEVWCEMLWVLTWDLIQQDGINPDFFNADGAGGNSVAMKLVTEGMKLQPCSPGFVDGRDAILKADSLLYGGRHTCTIWNAFASRGLGLNASEGSSYNYRDQVADFTAPVFASLQKTADKSFTSEGDNITYKLKVTCQCKAITNYSITDTLPANVTYVSGGTYNAAKHTVTFNNINIGALDSASFNVTVKTNAGAYQGDTIHLNEQVNSNVISNKWTTASTGPGVISAWNTTSAFVHSGPFAFYANETANELDSNGKAITNTATLSTTQSYTLKGISTLSFWHAYNTEISFDGGVVQVSTDSGATWQPVAASAFTKNGYNSNVPTQFGSFMAFSGNSGGYIESIIDLSSYDSKKVMIRFALTSDPFVRYDGWYIDDVVLKSESGVYNMAQLFTGTDSLLNNSSATSIIQQTLPVTWNAFTAVKQGNTSLLHWSTLQEINTDKFIVERSIDGVNYTPIGSVPAAVNSNSLHNYTFTDAYPLKGDNKYRIRQVDKDGKAVLSEIRMLSFEDIQRLISIVPNPAKAFLKITITGNNEPLKISLTDASGKTVARYVMDGQFMQLGLPRVAAGTYFINIKGATTSYQQKIVIQ